MSFEEPIHENDIYTYIKQKYIESSSPQWIEYTFSNEITIQKQIITIIRNEELPSQINLNTKFSSKYYIIFFKQNNIKTLLLYTNKIDNNTYIGKTYIIEDTFDKEIVHITKTELSEIYKSITFLLEENKKIKNIIYK